MGYYIDLEKISLIEYKNILKSSDLLPSRMVLRENIEENFELLRNQDIQNVDELLERFKTKKKLMCFADENNFDANYLMVLIREVKSFRQKPNKLKYFPELSDEIILKLENLGLKNTFQLFEKIKTCECRKVIAQQLDITENEILRLTKLTDLSRIRWVNHTFAFVLLEANYDTVEKVANADYKELYETVKLLNENRKIYRGHIGLNDMKRCVEAAKDVSLEIEY